MADSISGKWLWPEGLNDVDQYVEFRYEFEAAGEAAELELSADTNFVAWVNGEFVGSGQFSDYPEAKTFSTMDIAGAIQSGKNVLAVLVHYCGVDHFSYIPGQAGLWFNIKCGSKIITSSSETFCRVSPSYSKGGAKLTPQMGFTFEYDAAGEDSWRNVEYLCDESWQRAAELAESLKPVPRPLPMLEYKQRPVSNIIAQGLFRRDDKSDATVAELMHRDFLSARRSWELFDGLAKDIDPVGQAVTLTPTGVENADGAYIIFDLDREECGLVDIELEAPAGVVVDIAVGEHLEDMRVRSAVGGRNFASRYITREGRNKFTHYTNRYAGRYVQLHLSNISGATKIIYAGLIPADYPIEFKGQFNSADSLDKDIFEMARRTMHLCMHEHYEDCPWREQALYANDARNQALAGYYAFGEYEFPKVCFDLLRRTFSADGYQELCAPMKFDFTIPSFTMAWYVALGDYLLYSGDVENIKTILPQIAEMLSVYKATLVDELLPSPQGSRYWHFYDWADGLSGEDVHPTNGGVKGQRFDGPMNFMYVLALKAVNKMADACGQGDLAKSCQAQADETLNAAREIFWDADRQAYKTYVGERVGESHYAELTQSLALLCGEADSQREARLRISLADENNGMVSTTLSQSLYKFEALMQQPAEFSNDVFGIIQADWGRMLFAGATSFWETLRGGWDFDCAGSMCHGWSGIPAYFYGAYALGIKPLGNGFKAFAVAPAVNAFDKASGTVPTPQGNIEISWQKTADGVIGELTYPVDLTPEFADNIDLNLWKIVKFD